MIAKRSVRMIILAACLAVVSSLGLSSFTEATAASAPTVSKASASEPSSPGLSYDDSSKTKNTEPKDDVVITATVVGSALAEAIAKGISKATGSSYAFAAAQVQAKAEYRKQGCIWSSGTNSYYSGGVLQVYFDSVPMKLCPLKHPVSAGGYTWHYIKVDGGRSGTNCGNYANPSQSPPPGVQTLLVLDVKAGTIAKVKVFSKVCVEVTATVDVTLSYTYEGKTYTVHRSNTDTDSACKVKRDFAKKRITKHTSRHASAQSVARAKARVETQATTAARTAAIVKASAKAVRTVSVVIHIDRNEAPSMSATANACVDYGQSTGIVSGTLTNPNDEAHPFTVSSPGKSPFSGTVGANTNAAYQLYGFAPGTYDVTATLTDINLSTTVRVTVNPCPPQQQEKPTVSDTKINDVEQGGFMRNYRVSYNIPGSHSGTLVVNATYGKFVLDGQACSAPAVSRFTVSGSNVLVLTYCAHMDPTGPTSDTVTVTLRDDTTGLSATPLSQTFATPPASTHPPRQG